MPTSYKIAEVLIVIPVTGSHRFQCCPYLVFSKYKRRLSIQPCTAVEPQCMDPRWMWILVRGPASRKPALARTAAARAGRPRVELTLTGSTDTSDLLGGFEQLEPARQVQVRRLGCQLAVSHACSSSFYGSAPQI